jgi:repressor LexA
MNKKATSPQSRDIQLLKFLYSASARSQLPPTIREIQKKLKFSSTSVVNYRVQFLVSLGLLRRPRRVARALFVTPKGKRLLGKSASLRPSLSKPL